MNLGSRAQLLLALSAVFLLSFGLLSLSTVQLARRNAELEQARVSEHYASALLRAFSPRQPQQLRDALLDLHAGGTLVAAQLTDELGTFKVGTATKPMATSTVKQGRRTLALSLKDPPPQRSVQALGRLQLFYVAITGLSVMVLAYVLLTWTIVRPLNAATNSAEALAQGALHVRMPLTGAAEVVRLSSAFNRMAEQLRQERLTLEGRVEELEAATAALRETQDRVIHAEKLASIGRMSAGIAHEIGNPLSAVIGMLELLQDEQLDESDQREFLSRIQREAERIHGIISDLLTYARRDSEDPDSRADVVEVVDNVMQLLKAELSKKGITVTTELPPSLPFHGGAPQLTQVLMNLTLNASDAVSDGGNIMVRGMLRGDEALLMVEDDGPGLAPEVSEHLFEPFITSKGTGQGTGLGLFVCHALLERMSGSIRAESRTPRGARFVVTLRAAVSPSSH